MPIKKMLEKSAEKSKELAEKKIDTMVNKSGEKYIVTQVILKETLIGVGSKNLFELQEVINKQCELGYILHTCSVTKLDSEGIGGGDRLQATLVFKRIN